MSQSSAIDNETVKEQPGKTSAGEASTGKTKVEKAHSYLTLIYTTTAVLGAIGTAFVWLTTTFFLGDVQIIPNHPVEGVTVKVIDKRGQAATYFGKDVQLLPGHYHIEVGLADSKNVQHADVNVQLWKITSVPFNVPATGSGGGDGDSGAGANDGTGGAGSGQSTSDDSSSSRKHWWQFWKK
jgi:hypothetical protein